MTSKYDFECVSNYYLKFLIICYMYLCQIGGHEDGRRNWAGLVVVNSGHRSCGKSRKRSRRRRCQWAPTRTSKYWQSPCDYERLSPSSRAGMDDIPCFYSISMIKGEEFKCTNEKSAI